MGRRAGRILSAVERRTGRGLAATGLLAILALTLRPDPAQAPLSAATPLLCLVCGNKGGVDVFLNLLLFAPLGAGLRLAGWPWRRVVLVAALLSLSIEVLQLTVVTGRDASLSDLVTNTAGAAAAAAIVPQWPALLLPRPRRAAGLLAGWIAIWLGVLAVSLWLQSPSSLRGRLVSTWPEGATTEAAFPGRVLRAAVNGVLAPRNELPPDPRAIRRALDRGEATIDIVAISGRPTSDLAFLYSLRVRRTPLLGIAQYGRDAVLQVPSWAQRLRLWSPTLQVRDAFPPGPGVRVELHGSVRDGVLRLRATWDGQRHEGQMALRPTLGWTAVPPAKFVLGRRVGLLTALWLGALVLPLGYWGAATARPLAAAGAAAVALAAGLGLLPVVAGTQSSHWSEWTAGALGVCFGWALHRLAAYLQGRCGAPSPSISGSSSS